MKIVFFDTETTGFTPGQICQLSYIILEDGILHGKNHYFDVDFMPPGASAVHGLTKKLLALYSGGAVFKDKAAEVAEDFNHAGLLVAHNFRFDYIFLRTELERAGLPLLYKNDYCTMQRSTPVCRLIRNSGGYKYPKLDELVRFCGLNEQELSAAAENIFGEVKSFHDARFDTAATYLSFLTLANYDAVAKNALSDVNAAGRIV